MRVARARSPPRQGPAVSVRVRYKGTELDPEGVVEDIREANYYQITEDNTLVLFDDNDNEIGHVSRGQWVRVQQVVNAAGSED
jgi:hypothetical protein